MTCKDCIHYDVCQYNAYLEATQYAKDEKIYVTIRNNIACKFFKNKADVVEVKHGKWINGDMPTYGGFKCTSCKKNSIQNSKYCPNCGARMDGSRDA